MSVSPKLMLPAAYVTDAAKHIRQAKTRVSFLSMIVADDSSTDELIDALAGAAERGVTVEVAADVFTYGELGGSERDVEVTELAHRAKRLGRKEIRDDGAERPTDAGRDEARGPLGDGPVFRHGPLLEPHDERRRRSGKDGQGQHQRELGVTRGFRA